MTITHNLFNAINANNEELALSIIHTETNLDFTASFENQQMNVLTCAASKGLTNIIKALNNKGADVNNKDEMGRTPLSQAILGKHIDTVKFLLNVENINVNAWSGGHSAETTPLMDAIDIGAVDILELLLDDPRVDVNLADPYGVNPLLTAAIKGDKEILNILLNCKQVNINHVNDLGETALHVATNYNFIGSVKLLIDAGINVEAQDYQGKTALDSAYQPTNLFTLHILKPLQPNEEMVSAIEEATRNLEGITCDFNNLDI